jgi:hypothetical protein
VRPIGKLAAAAAVALVTLASTAAAQAPPDVPNIPDIPGGKTAKFKMTVHGMQHSFFAFSWTPHYGGCSVHAEGQLSEDWEFARGQGVVLEFTKLPGGLVLLKRQGRGLGDAAFAATGGVVREANGFFDYGPEQGCGGQRSLVDPDVCGQEFKVNSDLRLSWRKGRLTLERATRNPKNPAAGCGNVNGSAFNFELFTYRFPVLDKQRADFSKTQIFGHKRGFKLEMKDHFLEPLHEPVYESVDEKTNGESTLTLKRLRN